MEGDECIVNCIEPHPHTMTIASSGIDNDVKLWTPSAIEQARVLNVEEVNLLAIYMCHYHLNFQLSF
jgi:WD repeat-containing protein 42A